MTKRNQLTQRQEKAIKDVGREIETARLARRLSIREAASRTKTRRGPLTEATWRRVEHGYTQVGVAGHTQYVTYRPSPETLTAMAEVLDLDAVELCRKVGLEAVPAFQRPKDTDELSNIRMEMARLIERIDQLASNQQAQVSASELSTPEKPRGRSRSEQRADAEAK